MATNTYVALDKVTVGTATPTVTFTGISQAYTDLRVVIDGGISQADANTFVRVGNGSVDTGANYSGTFIEARATTGNSSRFTSTTSMQLDYYGSMSTTKSNLTLDFMNYSNTTTYKNVLSRYGNNTSTTYKGVGVLIGIWRSISAINVMTFSLGGGNFNVGTTFSLYGIKAEPALTAKATGGTIGYGADGYIYHTFTSSGTFTPNQTLTCQTLVVGGGGGGGAFNLGTSWGNGGNGGNVTYSSSASYTATGYTVTIGSGGSGGTGSSGASGGSGTTSSVNSITASGAGMASGPGYGVGGTISTYRTNPAAGIGVEYLGYKVAGGGWYGQNGQNILDYPINSTQYGGGFQKGFTTASASTSPYFGGGGAGGSNTADGGTYAGQNGASGLVVIRYLA